MSDLDSLGRSLWWLESRGPDLDALLVPRVPSSGENAGKAAVRGKSKPSLNLALVDLKIEAESVLGHWCGQVVSAFLGLGRFRCLVSWGCGRGGWGSGLCRWSLRRGCR